MNITDPDTSETIASQSPATETFGGRMRGRGTETILLVEDEPGIRVLATQVLLNDGYIVLAAGDGVEAIKIAENQPGGIALLVTDVAMPGMGGLELAEALRSRFPNMKVLFSSGYLSDSALRQSVLQKKASFLQKPYTPRILTAKIRQVLDEK